MALPKGYETLFNEKRTRKTPITLTIAKAYVTISQTAAEKLGFPEYIGFAASPKAPYDVVVYGESKKGDGAFVCWDKKSSRVRRISSPDKASVLAGVLGLDLSKGTYKVTGTYDEKNDCLKFDSKGAKLIKR